MRRIFIYGVFILIIASVIAAAYDLRLLWLWVLFGPVVALGMYDMIQITSKAAAT